MTIEYDDYLKALQDDDILKEQDRVYMIDSIKDILESALSSPFARNIRSRSSDYNFPSLFHNKESDLLNNGVDCEILKVGKDGWQKGKLRVSLNVEFIPDKPEIPVYQSPLDEIYREIQGLQ
jgi:hypothetical protein